ncbi:MAG: hypothetical protein ACRD3O_04025 [Terriglobia bacterium]
MSFGRSAGSLTAGDPGRAENWDDLTVVSAIDAKIFLIYRNHRVAREQLAQTDQAQVSQIRLAILVSFRQLGQAFPVLAQIEGNCEHAVLDQRQDIRN